MCNGLCISADNVGSLMQVSHALSPSAKCLGGKEAPRGVELFPSCTKSPFLAFNAVVH